MTQNPYQPPQSSIENTSRRITSPDSDISPLVFRATKGAYLMIVCGVLLLVFLVVLDLPTSSPYAVTIMLIVMGGWKMSRAYVTLHSDYFQTQLAPIGGWHTVLYNEVTDIEENGKMLNIYYKKFNSAGGAKSTLIKLSLGEFDEAEQERFIAAFYARLPDSLFQ